MSVKAYIGTPSPTGYSGDPIDSLAFAVVIKTLNTEGPGFDEYSVSVNLPIGGTEMELCELLYQEVVSRCQYLSWTEPTMDEVFCVPSVPVSREFAIS